MTIFALIVLFSLVVGLMLLGIVVCHRKGWLLDTPGGRKDHESATPLIGGIVIFAVVMPALLWVVDWQAYWTLLVGASIMATVGIADDMNPIHPSFRLLVQLGVGLLVVVGGGLQIYNLGLLWGTEPFGLGLFSIPFSVLCVVFMINAVNMLDGMDGLAGSTVFFALLALGYLGALVGLRDFALMQLILATGLAGFLLFNLRNPLRSRAAAFLGDGGSMMLGFWLAWSAIYLVQPGVGAAAPVTIAFLLAFPAADALAVFVRRGLRRENPMKADKGHVHHILLRAGFSVPQVLSILIGLQLVWLALALWMHENGVSQLLQLVLVAVIMLSYVAFVLRGRRIIKRFGPASR